MTPGWRLPVVVYVDRLHPQADLDVHVEKPLPKVAVHKDKDELQRSVLAKMLSEKALKRDVKTGIVLTSFSPKRMISEGFSEKDVKKDPVLTSPFSTLLHRKPMDIAKNGVDETATLVRPKTAQFP